jgi:hypothetical protein
VRTRVIFDRCRHEHRLKFLRLAIDGDCDSSTPPDLDLDELQDELDIMIEDAKQAGLELGIYSRHIIANKHEDRHYMGYETESI